MNKKLDFVDLYLLIQKTKKINFSSEKNVKKTDEKYFTNFKKVGKLNNKSIKEFFKKEYYYEKSNIIDSHSINYKTLIIKRKICFNNFEEGEKLRNLPGWKSIEPRYIYHKAHIIAKSLGGKRIYYNKKSPDSPYPDDYYNGFIGTKCANVGITGNLGMTDLEGTIGNYLYNNKNNYILYECRVIYKRPKDKIPIFIVIIIVSDDYLINKIYFIWNIEYGYTIDYKTGNFSLWSK